MADIDLRIKGKAWEALAELAAHIEEEQEKYAVDIEDAANLVLKQTHGYTRGGQWPALTNSDELGASFDVSNNRDESDDFSTEITWTKLNDAFNGLPPIDKQIKLVY